ncbi:uncharacterized protein [Periplaneta americana]|uniref:uncharacterized protein n=1 Tax=Periplaneta americana TaxID=6978 RepID=UPI0037E95421
MTWVPHVVAVVVLCCCYAQGVKVSNNEDFVDVIMDIVDRIEGVTKMTVDMANTIKSLGEYSNEKWGYDFFKIQLKTAAIYKRVIEYSRRNTEITKIKEAAKEFQKTSVISEETRIVDKLKKLIDASIKTKILAEKLYEVMEPYKYVTTYPEDTHLREILKRLEITVHNVYYVLDTTFDFLNYIDKKTWCIYIKKFAPSTGYC